MEKSGEDMASNGTKGLAGNADQILAVSGSAEQPTLKTQNEDPDVPAAASSVQNQPEMMVLDTESVAQPSAKEGQPPAQAVGQTPDEAVGETPAGISCIWLRHDG